MDKGEREKKNAFLALSVNACKVRQEGKIAPARQDSPKLNEYIKLIFAFCLKIFYCKCNSSDQAVSKSLVIFPFS